MHQQDSKRLSLCDALALLDEGRAWLCQSHEDPELYLRVVPILNNGSGPRHVAQLGIRTPLGRIWFPISNGSALVIKDDLRRWNIVHRV